MDHIGTLWGNSLLEDQERTDLLNISEAYDLTEDTVLKLVIKEGMKSRLIGGLIAKSR